VKLFKLVPVGNKLILVMRLLLYSDIISLPSKNANSNTGILMRFKFSKLLNLNFK